MAVKGSSDEFKVSAREIQKVTDLSNCPRMCVEKNRHFFIVLDNAIIEELSVNIINKY